MWCPGAHFDGSREVIKIPNSPDPEPVPMETKVIGDVLVQLGLTQRMMNSRFGDTGYTFATEVTEGQWLEFASGALQDALSTLNLVRSVEDFQAAWDAVVVEDDEVIHSESGDCEAMGIAVVPESSENFNVENSQVQWSNPTGADVVVSLRIGQIPEGAVNGFVEWSAPIVVQPASIDGYAETDLAQTGGTFLYEWTVAFAGMSCVHTQRFNQ